ncbi:hypothetical protein yc1106_03102 [Curvularia clavata]|uniref:Uncharacterized protein n=1 Tax=Curvularia clavata TaxID=95742 RepID=A0A9Q8Z8M0_CURCL|nr:hypothetical protein yc1106_03102 [Curvularia clavata]
MSAANPRYYYSLPTEAPQRSRSGSRRPPLTPSTVSSPCLTTLVPTTSRRDSATSGSPIKASILLAKVASSPTTPRGETPPGSPMLSPRSRLNSEPSYSSDRPAMSRTESDRYVRQYRQQGTHTRRSSPLATSDIAPDGYISFPDFEKFCQNESPYGQQDQQADVKA